MTRGKKIAILSVVGGGGSAAATIGGLSAQNGQKRSEDDYYSEELEEDASAVTEEVTPAQEEVQTPPQSSPVISAPVADKFSNTINPLLKKGITSIDYTYKDSTTPPAATKNKDRIQNVLGEWKSSDHQYVKSSLQITSKKWKYQDKT